MDLSQLQAALAGLGPWGIVLGVAITLAVQWYKGRQPAPAAGDPSTPLLDAVLNLIRVKHTSAPAQPVKRDIDHETADNLIGSFGSTRKGS